MIKQKLRVARFIAYVAVTLATIGGSDGTAQDGPTNLACDDSLKSVFVHNPLVHVTLIRFFQKGDPLLLSGTATSTTPLAANSMCMVKLTVGPGNPGPVTAPSTSTGIGIEIWLPAPANWNGRIHVLGGSGWGGGEQTSTTAFGQSGLTINAWDVAGTEGAVSATTDTGHTVNDGTFAMSPDGTINTVLWNDYSRRSLHEMAVQTKVLARAYYGSAPRYSYWHGGSTGGRQGIKEAQDYPEDFDGIVAGMPAINFTNMQTAEMYPQIVIQRDLGGEYLSSAQLTAVSIAAINACDIVGGRHLGYIPEPQLCKYDPTIDPAVLCWTNGGSNTTASCVTPRQAEVFNKVWYGQTSDGTAPSPATDNGFGSSTAAGNRRWYGLTRGTNLNFLMGPTALSSDMIALEMQDPSLGSPTFVNATGDGTDRWKSLTYYQLSEAFDRGVALQIPFAQINTDDTDLSRLRKRGAKLITYHGLADYLIFPQGSIEYYDKVVARMGGLSDVQTFFGFYLVPGLGHFPSLANGNANTAVNPPLPNDPQWYSLITDWVEKGIAPDRVIVTSVVDSNNPVQKSRPLCLYPLKAIYSGGDPNQAGSYVCSR
jgi:Tannase and feruloyl esterase